LARRIFSGIGGGGSAGKAAGVLCTLDFVPSEVEGG